MKYLERSISIASSNPLTARAGKYQGKFLTVRSPALHTIGMLLHHADIETYARHQISLAHT